MPTRLIAPSCQARLPVIEGSIRPWSSLHRVCGDLEQTRPGRSRTWRRLRDCLPGLCVVNGISAGPDHLDLCWMAASVPQQEEIACIRSPAVASSSLSSLPFLREEERASASHGNGLGAYSLALVSTERHLSSNRREHRLLVHAACTGRCVPHARTRTANLCRASLHELDIEASQVPAEPTVEHPTIESPTAGRLEGGFAM